MSSHCQVLRGILEFKFDVAVKKNIFYVTLEILRAKYLSVCHKRRGCECHLVSSAYICEVLLFPVLMTQS